MQHLISAISAKAKLSAISEKTVQLFSALLGKILSAPKHSQKNSSVKMAEVDFGATELIQQLNDFTQPAAMHDRFTDDEEDQDDTSQLGSRLEDCDGYIQRLTEENILGLAAGDVNIDGPLLQVLYTNIISKQCRQEIEDSICSVILKHQKDGHEKKQSCFHMKPQLSKLLQNIRIFHKFRLGSIRFFFATSNDGNTTEDSNLQTISFDVAEMVDCPGFNVLAPDKMKDELMQDDSIPMQNNLMKKSNAAYLTDNFPMLGSTCNKRRHESGSSPQLKKKKRSGPDCNSDRISDIDIETGRPPSSPTNGSPVLQEKPKKQQRLIWAALENADTTTNSDCETPVMGTPVPSSASISTRVYADTETEEVEESVGPMRPAETSHSNENKNSLEEICSRSPGPHKVEMESPQSPEPVKAQDNSAQDPGQIKSHNDSTKNPNPIKSQEDNLQSPDFSNEGAKDWASHRDVKMIKAVPHRSRFAAGILPFEETPEFTEVAESTGTYLRIRDILKGSPRSLAKKK
ncbi:Zinc finger CCHC domain-containing protein 8 TRAMP-like complex RNA-binding factor ZCCHC8 [Channa argus]|uniref:Zinc finger CCHC domain-containing protein 8 TRAMP-like complex RNA-binding factor ZCCHC8 n=1 Tax=Channa argus TaxID=215402 RepID=A0A6G1R1R2_CHAAH|nr:Zinc finger CCHC domain-containing protein 8 TRAMP-like complex RNA-binding factor ZCCHC8 [Channa argus]